MANVAGFLQVLRFSLPILIQSTAPQSSSSGAGTIGHIVADIPVDSVSCHLNKLKMRPKKLVVTSF
jgi:hypothetical protein